MMRMSSTPASRSRAPASSPPKPPPIDDDLDLVRERLPREAGLDVRVVDEAGEVALDLDVLVVAVRAEALVALGAVPVAEGVGVEAELCGIVRHGGEIYRTECTESSTLRASRRPCESASRSFKNASRGAAVARRMAVRK